jgi:sugar-specific transcriptional regulator TrmB
MIVEKNFLTKLKAFGLNSYEAKLWAALLSRGTSTAGELSDISSVPRSRTYDVLESLETKGFIQLKIGKPIKYNAVPPSQVIETVKRKIDEEAKIQTEELNKIKNSETIKELNNLHSQGSSQIEPSDMSASIKGRDNIYNHLELKIKNAKKTIHMITTSEGLIRKSGELKKSFESAKKNGAKIKIIAPLTKEAKEAAKSLKEFAEIKNVDKIKSRFLLIDGKEMMLMLTDDKQVHPSYDFGVWINTPFFTKTVEDMFENVWDKA